MEINAIEQASRKFDCHTGKARDRELRPARHVAIEADLGPAEVLPVFRHRYQLAQWRVELDDVRKEFGRILRVRLIHTLDGARQPPEAASERAHDPV